MIIQTPLICLICSEPIQDFAPSFLGLIPTKRLFASDYVWCSLNSESKADIETFKDILDRHF